MRPTTKTDVKFEHIGAARLYNGSVRIDVKTMQAVIPAGEVRRLEENWPAPVYDISDVMKNADAAPVGKAWITRSGKAVMIPINDVQYVSPLAQVKGMLKGERKYANVSTMNKSRASPTTPSLPCRGDRMTTIFDAMPIQVLEELERIETTIPEIGAPGFSPSGKCPETSV